MRNNVYAPDLNHRNCQNPLTYSKASLATFREVKGKMKRNIPKLLGQSEMLHRNCIGDNSFRTYCPQKNLTRMKSLLSSGKKEKYRNGAKRRGKYATYILTDPTKWSEIELILLRVTQTITTKILSHLPESTGLVFFPSNNESQRRPTKSKKQKINNRQKTKDEKFKCKKNTLNLKY